MLEILTRITKGQGKEGDIELLEELAANCKETSTCGLGQTAGNPVLSTLRLFREEYEEHIRDRYCRAGVCADLFKSPCQNACPAGVDVPGYVALIAAGRPRDRPHGSSSTFTAGSSATSTKSSPPPKDQT